MKDSGNFIGGIKLSRKNFVELIVLVVVLSLGINILAGQFLNWLKDQSTIVLFVGTLLCIVPILYMLISLFGRRKKRITVQGFVVYDPFKKELVNVPRYLFAQTICSYISAAFFENTALKLRWEKQPLKPFRVKPAENEPVEEESHNQTDSEPKLFSGNVYWRFGKVISAKENATVRLLCEAVEYFLITRLSFHLNGYFNDKAFKANKLVKYAREDIPTVLLSNPFLELFTREKADRPAFAERMNNNINELEYEDDDKDETTYSMEEEIGGGAKYLYHPFKLVLPKGSKVKRLPDHQIEIETKKLKLILSVKFETRVLAFDIFFFYFYLHNKHLFNRVAYEIKIDLQVSMKWQALLTSSGWNYYEWVDSFFNIIEEEVSGKAFLNEIHWEEALTVLLCMENADNDIIKEEDIPL
jgi:hypothetical protein